MSSLSVNVSVLTLVMISIDRYKGEPAAGSDCGGDGGVGEVGDGCDL